MEKLKENQIKQEEIREFIDKGIGLLKKNYVYPEVAEQVCAKLLDSKLNGKYNVSMERNELKELLDGVLQSVNQDKHLHIYFQEEKPHPTQRITMRKK
jgi:hypothetical protein